MQKTLWDVFKKTKDGIKHKNNIIKFFSEKEEVLLKNLTENNRLDEFAVNKFEIVGDAYSACAINENKEFNFKQLVKEALTPHYLK